MYVCTCRRPHLARHRSAPSRTSSYAPTEVEAVVVVLVVLVVVAVVVAVVVVVEGSSSSRAPVSVCTPRYPKSYPKVTPKNKMYPGIGIWLPIPGIHPWNSTDKRVNHRFPEPIECTRRRISMKSFVKLKLCVPGASFFCQWSES